MQRAVPAAPREYLLAVTPGLSILDQPGRDHYVRQLSQRRQVFQRRIAGTRASARLLLWCGLAVGVVDCSLLAASLLSVLTRVGGDLDPEDAAALPLRLGMSLGACAGGVAAAGLVLHLVAAARHRRLEREFPAPAWVRSRRY